MATPFSGRVATNEQKLLFIYIYIYCLFYICIHIYPIYLYITSKMIFPVLFFGDSK